MRGGPQESTTSIDTTYLKPGADLHRRESLPMSVLGFAAHQLIATWGVALSVGVVFNFALNLLRWLGWSIPSRTTYFLLSGNPYFPVQITLGLVLGLLLGTCLQRRSMAWVWVIPFAILLYAFITALTLAPE